MITESIIELEYLEPKREEQPRNHPLTVDNSMICYYDEHQRIDSRQNYGRSSRYQWRRISYTENTGNNTTDGNNSNDSIIKILTGNRNGQSSRINTTVDTSNKVFEGAEPDIVCVLGLRFEKVDKKVAHDVFHDKFSN